ncbi:MAG: YhcH/YjgK/YiaL family protein [Oscillospiraceae bacterium]
MIVDSLKNAPLYYALGERFEKGLRFLQENGSTLSELPEGIHPIDGTDVYLQIQRYHTVPQESCRFENHHKYADIQFLAEGSEWFDGGEELEALTLCEQAPERDVWFYCGGTPETSVKLSGERFVLVFPPEPHRPRRAVDEVPQPVCKALIKVRVN